MSTTNIILGAHLSTSGGFYTAIERAIDLDCTALQIFVKNNRQWKARAVTPEAAEKFKATRSKSSIQQRYIFGHATYLANLASVNPITVANSLSTLQQELLICEQLEIPWLVLHPGAHTTQTLESALDQLVHNLQILLDQRASSSGILLETMAGQGSTIGYTFEQLGYILSQLPTQYHERIGICLDTCHIFAAGYSFANPADYQQLWATFDKLIGLRYLKLIHLNDSKSSCGSKVDRHQHIGQGHIGIDTFAAIMNDPKLASIAKIIETPKKTADADLHNLTVLRNLITE